MPGVAIEDFRRQQPVLVKLRRQFDEIAHDAGAGNAGIGDIRQQPVQPVTKFVEQRAGIVDAQKRWLAGRALHEIQHIDDDRFHLAVEPLLIAVARHPCAGAFRRPPEIVAHEQPHGAPVTPERLPHTHLRVINGEVGALLEGEAEQTPRGIEGGFDHAVQLEIGLDLVLVEVMLSLADLLGIIAPVPRGDGKIPLPRSRISPAHRVRHPRGHGPVPTQQAADRARQPWFSPWCRRA